jgi:hypothetical protein
MNRKSQAVATYGLGEALVYDRKIRFVMVDGIAPIPVDALEEYRTQAS